MNELTSRSPTLAGAAVRRFSMLLAGISGCLFLATNARYWYDGALPTFLPLPSRAELHGPAEWALVSMPVVATVVGLCALRWWPYLLLAAGLLAVPSTLTELARMSFPLTVTIVCQAGYPLTIVGVLACAQALAREATGWAAAVTGLSIGAHLFGSVMVGAGWLMMSPSLPTWYAVLIAVGFVGVLPAAWWKRRGDPAATGPFDAGRWPWRRLRLVVAAGLAVCVVIPLSFLTTERLAALLGVSFSALYRHAAAEVAVIGAVTLVIAAILAAVAGLWSLAGALTAATAQVAVVAPALLAVTALAYQQPVRWLGALAGVALGAVVAGNRWRIPGAATLAVLAAVALFIAYGATTGHPEKLADQHRAVPALLILVLITAAATALVGATAPVLAPRGALPAALGPLAGVLAAGGLATVQVTYLRDGLPVSSYLNPVFHLTTSALLLLVASAAIGGLGLARQLATRRAERKHAEQIRREAALAERDRLARPIHDGVLQVLALVQRHGSEAGGEGNALAALAREQEVALRALLSGEVTTQRDGSKDLRISLRALGSSTIEVSAPAEPVVLAAGTVVELTAAVQAALDNVRQHAGPSARAWVLLEDEQDGVRVTVRDDGVGFPPERLAEAAEAGRLGVVQSLRGRISDLGGTTTIDSLPGEGTEVEVWVPRRRTARR